MTQSSSPASTDRLGGRPGLTISIPAYNEIENIRNAVDEAVAVARMLPLLTEILVVDDGSTDGTSGLIDEIVASAGAVPIRAIHHPSNRGFSGAIRSALLEARGDLVLLVPADGQVGMNVAIDFVPAIEGVDGVVGVRARRADPPYRRALSWVFHTLARTLLGIRLREFSSTFLFRRALVADLPLTSRASSGALLPELLARATRRGARFREVTIEHYPRRAGVPKGGQLRVAVVSLLELVRIAWVIRHAAPEPQMKGASSRLWAVVAARMGSERMPGKSMALFAGRPAFAHIVDRLRRSRHLHGIVLATTEGAEDDPLRGCARQVGVPAFSGSATDVLGRTLGAARYVGADVIVQITGDCPLIDPDVVDRVIDAYLAERPDYASDRLIETYPNGMDTEVFATSVLAEVDRATNDPADREHVSLYIYEHPERYRLLNVPAPPEHVWPQLRLTLDTPEDYALISALYEALYPVDPTFGLDQILTYLRDHPELLELNRAIQQRPAR